MKSNKTYDKRSNNTSSQRGDTLIGTFANKNKFAVLGGEKPKEEVSFTKKMENFKTPNTKKNCKKTNDTKDESFVNDSKNKSFVNDSKNKSFVNDSKNKSFVNDSKNKLFVNDSRDKFTTDQQEPNREHRPFKKFTDIHEDIEEQKKLYVETHDNTNELGNNMFLNSPWTVWIHKADCQVWTEESYTNIYVVNSIGSFWRFFNNFHALDKVRNQCFIMRNKIKPIWEDNDNRNGGICSIKLDCFSKQGRIDIGVEIMICICLLVMNETLIQSNEEINGISYSIKNRSVLIKLWCKNFNNKISEKLPIGLFSKLDTIMRNMDRDRGCGRKPPVDNKISIRCTQIKPEYDVE
jgi:hypothetical protein